jgi:hypothetical protein
MKKFILTIIFFVIAVFKSRKPTKHKVTKEQTIRYAKELMKAKLAARKPKIKKYKNSH